MMVWLTVVLMTAGSLMEESDGHPIIGHWTKPLRGRRMKVVCEPLELMLTQFTAL
jgi:hypothetical protein